ncbi:GfV-B60-ORF2 [Ichnoviriform fumiferanae]|uniref:GfV-B60-ORF2 n=1 Tax=Ichnoviriform fumiferanae TaxID=419435 RepID=A2PZV5_9VIRU|nr:GfV-B60-ORF2 [Ichnoviriform fumiferanae]BAF45527.1 GfV-B60-ORF2 [Ichnoviriform fumiferanae]
MDSPYKEICSEATMKKRSTSQVHYNAENEMIRIQVNNLATIEDDGSIKRPDSVPEEAEEQYTMERLESLENEANTNVRSGCGNICCKVWNCLWFWRFMFIVVTAIFIFLFIYVRRPVHKTLHIFHPNKNFIVLDE